jgi:DNA polymerase-3 subunit delta'
MPFRDVDGHRRLLELLARSVDRGTLPPSLTFAGPAGAGKRQTAIALAQTLNCLELRTANAEPGSTNAELACDACGRCAACTRIARGVHPDVLIVAPGDSGSIKIEQVREVIDRAAYRPFEGKRRVVIVDDADALMPQAQNALLKTLEEPPPSSVFILITTMPDVLLPTVRSRCIRLWFAARGAEEPDVAARDVAHRVLAHAAATRDAVRRIEGAKDLLTNTGSGGAPDREQLATHLRAMASLLRDVEALSTSARDTSLANPDVRPALERLTQTYRGERGVRAFHAIDQALTALDRNAGVKIVADWVVLQL